MARRVVIAAGLLAALLPASASAVTQVGVDASTQRLVASPASAQPVQISVIGNSATFFDSNDVLVSDPGGVLVTSGCQLSSATVARCDGFTSFLLSGGSKNDLFDVRFETPLPGTLRGAGGDDAFVSAIPVRETIDGGFGADLVTYSRRAAVHGSVRVVNPDSSRSGFDDGQVREDGRVNEDALVSVEKVTGTAQADRIHGGGSRSVRFDGRAGADVLTGGLHTNDLLVGRERPDETAASDRLLCGGGAGQDSSFDSDRAVMDLQDVASDCETEERAAIDEGGILRILNRRLRRRRGRAAVRLHCPRSSKTRCRGRLTISRRGRRLGSRRYRIRKGRRKTVRVRVKRGIRGRVLVRARERDSKGRPKTSLKRLRLR